MSILTDDREVTERWKQHYYEHLNGTQAEDQNNGGSDVIGEADEGDVPSSTIGKVRDAIKRPKHTKPAGEDSIGAELRKEWKYWVIFPIYMKGNKLSWTVRTVE